MTNIYSFYRFKELSMSYFLYPFIPTEKNTEFYIREKLAEEKPFLKHNYSM